MNNPILPQREIDAILAVRIRMPKKERDNKERSKHKLGKFSQYIAAYALLYGSKFDQKSNEYKVERKLNDDRGLLIEFDDFGEGLCSPRSKLEISIYPRKRDQIGYGIGEIGLTGKCTYFSIKCYDFEGNVPLIYDSKSDISSVTKKFREYNEMSIFCVKELYQNIMKQLCDFLSGNQNE